MPACWRKWSSPRSSSRENIQDTPIAITAVSAEMIERRSATNILDIAAAAPNVTMRLGSTGFGKSNQAFIRGVGQGDFLLRVLAAREFLYR